MKLRRAKFGEEDEHQVQFLGQFRKIYKIPGFYERNKDKGCPIYYIDPFTF